MTDRELLELAAKAANINIRLIKQRNTAVCEGDDYYEDLPEDRWFFVLEGYSQKWNPLTDDGDALRLAVRLGVDVQHFQASEHVEAWVPGFESMDEDYGKDPYAATRRAIVRAAALPALRNLLEEKL